MLGSKRGASLVFVVDASYLLLLAGYVYVLNEDVLTV